MSTKTKPVTTTSNVQVYLVGGAVRDMLLGLNVHDKDFVVVGATSKYLLDAGFTQVGADFPVFLHPDTNHEYALARTERKSGSGYQGFDVHASPKVTLCDDLKRRDLTINAMALRVHGLFDASVVNGHVIDPYGGQQDLENRILRHVSDAFKEDPLRVLRLARFYGRYANHVINQRQGAQNSRGAGTGFTIAEDTKALVKQMVNIGELQCLTTERVWLETARAMMQSSPLVYFECLHHLGALSVLLPQLNAMMSNRFVVQSLKGPLEQLATMNMPLHVRWAGFMLGFVIRRCVSNVKLSHLDESTLSVWEDNINTIATYLKLPNKVHHFSQRVVRIYPHLYRFAHRHMSDSSIPNTASDVAAIIGISQAHQHTDTLYDILTLFEAFGWLINRQQITLALQAYQSVTIKDINPQLQGAQIGQALHNLRLKRLGQVL